MPSEQIFNRSTGVDAVGAVEGVVQHGVVRDSQRVVHRGDEVVRGGRFVGGIGGVVVAGTKDLSTTNAASRHEAAVTARVMIAAGGTVDDRGTPDE